MAAALKEIETKLMSGLLRTDPPFSYGSIAHPMCRSIYIPSDYHIGMAKQAEGRTKRGSWKQSPDSSERTYGVINVGGS